MSPIVSVLMITMNHESYIREAIESILAQETWFPFELVIGEDYSSDSTADICRMFEAKQPQKIKLMASRENVGMHRNLSRIWAMAEGKYIALCEGDDYWTDPFKLAKQVAFMESHPSYTLCGTYTRKIRETQDGHWETAGMIGPPEIKDEYGLADLIPHYSFHTSSVLLRKDAVQFPPWFQDQYCADRPLYLLCAERGPAGFIPEIMSVYRLHGTGIWAPVALMDKAAKGRKLFETLNVHFDYCYDGLIKRTLGNIIWSYMAEAVVMGDLKTGRVLFRQASGYFFRTLRVDMARHWLVALVRLYVPGLYTLLSRLLRGSTP